MEVNTPCMDPMGFETIVNVCGHQHLPLGESVNLFVVFRSWLVLKGPGLFLGKTQYGFIRSDYTFWVGCIGLIITVDSEEILPAPPT